MNLIKRENELIINIVNFLQGFVILQKSLSQFLLSNITSNSTNASHIIGFFFEVIAYVFRATFHRR